MSETNAAVDHVFAFTGRPFDASTGLQNNLNRWYDASTGRWISQDPIGFAGGDTNIGRYVNNAPLCAIDPTGLAPAPSDASVEIRDPITGVWVSLFVDKSNKRLVDARGRRVLRLPEDPFDVQMANIISNDEASAWAGTFATTPSSGRDKLQDRWIKWLLQKMAENSAANVEAFALEHPQWGRNVHNEVPPEDVRSKWQRMPDHLSIYHRIGPGNENNMKFVSPDGHSEAVFNPDWTLVIDHTNMGTYNYADPNANKIGHFFYDIVPYWFWESRPDNRATPFQRLRGGGQGE